MTHTTSRKILLAAVFAALALSVTACENTWHGMGKDMEETGETMQDQYD